MKDASRELFLSKLAEALEFAREMNLSGSVSVKIDTKTNKIKVVIVDDRTKIQES